MTIKSKEEAFKILNSNRSGIPFEAISYLYDYGKDEEILSKVILIVENAYNDSFFNDKKNECYFEAPLWYAIVAESQLDERLADPIIKLFTTTKDDWDFLNEQGAYVLGKLCEEFGDVVIGKCMKACVKLDRENSNLPYLFLFEALDYAKDGKYDNEILDLLNNPNCYWKEALIGALRGPKYIKLLPRLKEIKVYYDDMVNKNIKEEHIIIELKETIASIEGKRADEDLRNYSSKRSPWKLHYKKSEDRFVETPPVVEVKKIKIGRNDPCHCGSGKKYKKCCLNLE